ncbi:MAG: hypothetical protein ACT4PW_14290 [Acidimicrobiia bacterium]
MSLPGLTGVTVFCPAAEATVGAQVRAGGLHASVQGPACFEGTFDAGEITVRMIPYPIGPTGSAEALVAAVQAGAELRAGGRVRALAAIVAGGVRLDVGFAPGLVAGDDRARAVMAVAAATDGIIFDSRVLRDCHGSGLVSVASSRGPVRPPSPGLLT